MKLRFDAMHDEQLTKYAEMGWTEELGKLEKRPCHARCRMTGR